MTEMPKAETLHATQRQDRQRKELSRIEDQVLEALDTLAPGLDRDQGGRWLAIARTQIQQGFMAAKRAIYEGKRVGDP